MTISIMDSNTTLSNNDSQHNAPLLLCGGVVMLNVVTLSAVAPLKLLDICGSAD